MSNSQHVILDALEAEVDRLIEEGHLDPEVYDNVPESHVFYPSDGPLDEDDVAAIRMVGDDDMNRKINYFKGVIDNAAS